MNEHLEGSVKSAARLAQQVQAGIGRVGKLGDGRTRGWSLYAFFRILPPLAAASRNDDGSARFARISASRLSNPGLFEVAEAGGSGDLAQSGAMALAPEFRRWLLAMTEPDAKELADWFARIARELKDELAGKEKPASPASAREAGKAGPFDSVPGLAKFLKTLRDDEPNGKAARELRAQYLQYAGVGEAASGPGGNGNAGGATGRRRRAALLFLASLFDRESLDAFVKDLGGDPGTRGLTSLAGGLPLVILRALIGTLVPAILKQKTPVIRAEMDHNAFAGTGALSADSTPANLAFTHSGLGALGLHPGTLASFPAAFREGMAARAERLGDTGESAPAHWHGELGLASVHGFLQTSFDIAGIGLEKTEEWWRLLRGDIVAFNERRGDDGAALRVLLNAICLPFGMEIVHLELGQDAYELSPGKDGNPDYRREHFGFRDGLSQPFVDLGLGAPPPGGATPELRGGWSPVAPGEIFLSAPDEDGVHHVEPRNAALREGSTYLVFRKLAQDVAGFNAFLEKQRPSGEAAREKLAAQIVGRWKNGVSLLHAPDSPRHADGVETINDFRYAKDDPHGRKCPLGSHVRRSNPRDTGGVGDVRRHRMLRRGISYGGSLLPPGSKGDGTERGLLFVAANARIEQQFELVQSRWLNGGEFLGQAGLGKCPLVGANDGGPTDQFREAGSVAPVTHLPRFVTMRGGDYFFAPGVGVLRRMAQGDSFPPELAGVIDGGRAYGDYEALDLVHPKRIRKLVVEMIANPGAASTVPVSLPDGGSVTYVRRHKDVKWLFAMETDGAAPASVTVRHLQEAGRRLTAGADIVIGTQFGTPTAVARERLKGTLNLAWQEMEPTRPIERIRNTTANVCEKALRRFGPSRNIDLVRDMATPAAYGFVRDVLGVPGPSQLTEIAMALPFGKQFAGSVHPDWFAALRNDDVEDRGMTTMQVWSALLLADLIGNVYGTATLKALAQNAASEMLTHIDWLVARARQRLLQAPKPPATLLEALVAVATKRLVAYGFDPSHPETRGDAEIRYLADIRAILMELAGTSMATIPHAFGHAMESIVGRGIQLPQVVARLRGAIPDAKEFSAALRQVILEAERLNPGAKVTLRFCAADTTLPSGEKLARQQWLFLMSAAANLDAVAFPAPTQFVIAALDPAGPARPLENYLMFGAGNDRMCWGRNRAAMVVLEEGVLAAARLQALRPVAGPEGQPWRPLGPMAGLKARFSSVAN